MDLDAPARRLAGLPERPWWRLFLYYAVVFGGLGLLLAAVPGARPLLNAPMPTSGFLGSGGLDATAVTPAGAAASGRVVLEVVVALASACLLMLPVTWVYVRTRRKRGFDQSLVQGLIILPLVVAGVVLLVRDSTALAFSLGGIVGAVAFRNRLRDTKDTIHIFLAIVVGVAAGVHALLAAATISVCFNVVAIVMWWTDFGREGAPLEGRPAEQRLRRAKDMADRSSGFISMVDRELLQSMTPEQLDALADRTRNRLHEAAASAAMDEELARRREWTLRLEVTGTAPQGRRLVEPLLETMVKQWRFLPAQASTAGSGEETLEYLVRIRKKDDQASFLDRFRAAAGPTIRTAELSRPK